MTLKHFKELKKGLPDANSFCFYKIILEDQHIG